MSKKDRVPRTQESIVSQFINQFEILVDHCRKYDEGYEHYGSEIATKLRVFLHSFRRSKSLISQMNFESPVLFLSTNRIIKQEGLSFSMPALCSILHKTSAGLKPSQSADYVPDFDSSNDSTTWLSFEDWWQELVILDSDGNEFTRQLIVAEVADTDGGAHVDPDITLGYDSLLNKNSAGMYFDPSNGIFAARYSEAIKHLSLSPPVMPTLRQIAHEVILSIKNHDVELALPKYSYKNYFEKVVRTI